MRAESDRARIEAFVKRLGERVRSPARVYLVGGATAVLEGWRSSTIDIDLRFEPENRELFEALPRLKDELDVNIELAWPSMFIPELPGWRDRSPWIARHGPIDVHHYDYYSQSLAKIERDHDRDRTDVAHLLQDLDRDRAWELFLSIVPELVRYPSIEPRVFRAKVERALAR